MGLPAGHLIPRQEGAILLGEDVAGVALGPHPAPDGPQQHRHPHHPRLRQLVQAGVQTAEELRAHPLQVLAPGVGQAPRAPFRGGAPVGGDELRAAESLPPAHPQVVTPLLGRGQQGPVPDRVRQPEERHAVRHAVHPGSGGAARADPACTRWRRSADIRGGPKR